MNIDAMLSQTKHVQFVTFHREDANKVGLFSFLKFVIVL